MKYILKKIISFITAVAVAACAYSSFNAFSAIGDTNWYIAHYMEYEQTSRNGILYCYFADKPVACVIGVESSVELKDGVLQIPEKVDIYGVERTVTGLSAQAIRSESSNYFGDQYTEFNNNFIGVKRIILPDTVKYIDLEALGTKEHPIMVEVGKNIETIKKSRHSHLKKSEQNLFEYITLDVSRSDKFEIKDNLLFKKGELVAALGGYETYTIPDYVDTLTGFAYCERIESIYIPKTVETILQYAFKKCKNLEKITFQKRESDIYIKGAAFENCNKVKTLTVPGRLRKDSYSSFDSMKGLEKVTFAKSFKLEELDGLFSNCSSLKEIKIPKSVKVIGHWTFDSCGFETFTVPEQIESIGVCAFEYCKNLKKIPLPKNLKKRYGNAFQGCENLEKITLPKALPRVNPGLFYKCKSLEQVKFAGENIKRLGTRAFYQCESLEKFTVPKKVTKIEEYAFKKCYDLETVTLSGNVKTVKTSAFAQCTDLETVNFKGKYLEKFEDYAFYKNTSLKKITISNTKNAPKFTKKTFRGAKKGIKFYVKNKTVAKKLKANLKRVGYTSAKIYADGKRYK